MVGYSAMCKRVIGPVTHNPIRPIVMGTITIGMGEG